VDIFDAAMKYQLASIPVIILAGKHYGTGSPRDWVAKGQAMLVCTMIFLQVCRKCPAACATKTFLATVHVICHLVHFRSGHYVIGVANCGSRCLDK